MEFPFPKETVLRLIKEKGYDDVIKLRDNYVGRGYDKYCIGFIAPEVRCVVQFLLELAGETEAEGVDLEDLITAAGTYAIDNMGFDAIVYFPTYHAFAESDDPYAGDPYAGEWNKDKESDGADATT